MIGAAPHRAMGIFTPGLLGLRIAVIKYRMQEPARPHPIAARSPTAPHTLHALPTNGGSAAATAGSACTASVSGGIPNNLSATRIPSCGWEMRAGGLHGKRLAFNARVPSLLLIIVYSMRIKLPRLVEGPRPSAVLGADDGPKGAQYTDVPIDRPGSSTDQHRISMMGNLPSD